MKLKISKEAYERMKDWLESHYPHEACGFFAGPEDGDLRTIDDLWSVENKSTENLRRRFVIGPIDYIQAEQRVESQGTNLLGLFHSHPDHPAFPSEHDLAAAQPYFSYIIASVHNGKMGDVRSFRLVDGEFVEEEVIVLSTNSKHQIPNPKFQVNDTLRFAEDVRIDPDRSVGTPKHKSQVPST